VSRKRRLQSPVAATAFGGASTAPARLGAIDAARGVAIMLMVGYHFCFDLRVFRLAAADFEHDPFWLGLRAFILSSFLALVGVSLVLADRPGTTVAPFVRRLALIAACAVAVSIASAVAFPQSFIYFGVLHCIAAASLLARPLRRAPRLAIALGLLVIGAGAIWSHPAFDARALSWIGFGTTKPNTVDYVPIFPWAGVTLLGTGVAGVVGRGLLQARLSRLRSPRWLEWMGRHSLAIYMIHQPVLMGILWLATSA
jgi:uncharacterized membrane protein